MSLFRLPAVKSVLPHSLRIAAVISLTEVLPEEPVNATMRAGTCERTHAASSPKARRVSLTIICGSAASTGRLTSNAPAPPCWAVCAKSWASKRSPLSATNRQPGVSLRVSVVTASITRSSPRNSPPSSVASCFRETGIMPPLPTDARRSHDPNSPDDERRRFDNLHGLYRQSAPRRFL